MLWNVNIVLYLSMTWNCCLWNSWSEIVACVFGVAAFVSWAVVSGQDNVWQGRRNSAALHPASRSDTETGRTDQEVPDVTGCYVHVCVTASPLPCDFGHGYDSKRSLRCVRLLLDFSLHPHWETILPLYGHVVSWMSAGYYLTFPQKETSNEFGWHPYFSSYGINWESTLCDIAFTKIFYYISHCITQYARHIFFISKAISTTQSNN